MIHRIAVWFLVAEALGAAVWWLVLLTVPTSRRYFVPQQSPDEMLLAFGVADGLLFIVAAAVAAWGISARCTWAWPVLLVHAGAAAYAALCCWTLYALTGEAVLGALMMTPSLIGPGISCLATATADANTHFHAGKSHWGGLMLRQIHARESRPGSTIWILTKTYSQMVVFWTFFLAVLPHGWLWLESQLGVAWGRFPVDFSRYVGYGLFACGGSLGITSAYVMARHGRGTPMPTDCASQLVIVGPYRYVRNPMAIAGLTQGVAVGLMLGSLPVVVYAILGGPIWHVLVRPWEEFDLARRFGAPYERYREQVWCWWPRYHPYPSTEMN